MGRIKKGEIEQKDKSERRSIMLPAYIWRWLEREAEENYRSLSRHIESYFVVIYKDSKEKDLDHEDKRRKGIE